MSIGELARRTGIGISTLRAWERRHGFPIPQRLSSGHRRYTESDVDSLIAVLRARRSGSSVGSALARARENAGASRSSILATVRQALRDVAPADLSKTTMIAISRAIEDETASRADRPILIATFQDERFWRQSERRWRDLAVASTLTIALAAGTQGGQRNRLWEVPVEPATPLSREWAVICDSPNFAACLVAVERPGSRPSPDGGRRFESLWTVEPVAVREAARAACAKAADIVPELSAALGGHLQAPAVATFDTVRAATALTNRIVTYLDQRRPEPGRR